MRMLLLSILLVLPVGCATIDSYRPLATDTCLAGACLSHTQQAIRARFGLLALPSEVFTWRLTSPNRAAFLEISVDPEAPDELSALLLTSIPPQSLVDCIEQVSDFPLALSTRRGIHLGSARSEVLAAYGPPASVSSSGGYPWSADPHGVEHLSYTYCAREQVAPSMSFFLKSGRVVGIAFWVPDC